MHLTASGPYRPHHRPPLRPLVLLLLLLTTSACAAVKVKPARPRERAGAEHSVLSSRELSPETRQLLRLYLLAEGADSDPAAALEALARRFPREWQPKTRSVNTALAELAVAAARKVEGEDPTAALGFYLTAAFHAWQVALTEAAEGEPIELLFHPDARFAADLYNFSVGRVLASLQARGGLPHGTLLFNGPLSPFSLRWESRQDAIPDLEEFVLLRADEVEIQGLSNRFRSRGLGAPLVALRKELPALRKELPAEPEYGYFPIYRHFYPLTALLTFSVPAVSTGPEALLTFHDPLGDESVELDGRTLPLEADFTATLALIAESVESHARPRGAMLRADRFLNQTGLFLPEPYRSDKIPVVLVHGLQSSALTWLELYNDLRGDPVLRRHYQFWLFNYPTGLPFTLSAHLLRESLLDTCGHLEQEGDRLHSQGLILVGHSMGGLLVRLEVTRVEDHLLSALFTRPLDELNLDPADRYFLSDLYGFEPLPFARRAIFISTPHRGSKLATNFLGKISASLVHLPAELEGLGQRVLSRNADALTPEAAERLRVPDAIETLSPDNPVLRALAELPVVPAVTFHTVVGDRGLGDGPETRSDGIVSYRSSHLEGAASELIVPSGHNAHQHPATIAEVRRILYEHLGVAGVGGPVASEPRAGEAEGVHDDGDRAEGHGHTGEHR